MWVEGESPSEWLNLQQADRVYFYGANGSVKARVSYAGNSYDLAGVYQTHDDAKTAFAGLLRQTPEV